MDHMEYGLEFCEKTLMPIIKNVVDKYIGTSYSIEKKGQGNFVTTVLKSLLNISFRPQFKSACTFRCLNAFQSTPA